MNKELKNQWVKALDSELYAQGTGNLRSYDDEYCCLGVLCDIINPAQWKNRYEDEDTSAYGEQWDWESEDGVRDGTEAPNWLEDILSDGTDYNHIDFTISDSIVGTLVELNDSEKRSFKEIAEWVEKNL